MLHVDNNNTNIPFNTHFAIQFDVATKLTQLAIILCKPIQ